MKQTDGERELNELIEKASGFAEHWFKKHGRFDPMYHAILENGEEIVLEPPYPDNKDLSVAMVKAWFEMKGVIRYVFVAEAWMKVMKRDVSAEDKERWGREGLSREPERDEAIMFNAEDREHMLFGKRMITRKGRKATLGPLVIERTLVSEGRMVGLLRPRATAQ